MHQLVLKTVIKARAATCFDLIRDRQIQPDILDDTAGERINGLGRTFVFENRYFGIQQRLKVLVIEYDRPNRFVDLMIEGYFASFFHIHKFTEMDGCTLITDTLEWRSPFGVVGKLADHLFVERRLRKLVATRNERLRTITESGPRFI